MNYVIAEEFESHDGGMMIQQCSELVTEGKKFP